VRLRHWHLASLQQRVGLLCVVAGNAWWSRCLLESE